MDTTSSVASGTLLAPLRTVHLRWLPGGLTGGWMVDTMRVGEGTS